MCDDGELWNDANAALYQQDFMGARSAIERKICGCCNGHGHSCAACGGGTCSGCGGSGTT